MNSTITGTSQWMYVWNDMKHISLFMKRYEMMWKDMKGAQFWCAWFRKRDMHCPLKFVLQLLLAFELVSSKEDLMLPRCLQQIGPWHWKATVILCSHLLTLCNLDCKPFLYHGHGPERIFLRLGLKKIGAQWTRDCVSNSSHKRMLLTWLCQLSHSCQLPTNVWGCGSHSPV